MSHAVDILGLTCAQLDQAAALAIEAGAGIAHRLYRQAMHGGSMGLEQLPIAAATAERWRTHFQVGILPVVRVVDDGDPGQGTAKAILATADGYEIECVRIPMRHGEAGETSWTLCVSSQVGCRMGCTFCETGRMGLLRHLSAAEIVAQVVTVQSQLGWQVRNLVFMGMGEALDNCDAVIQALQVLTDRSGLHYSKERLTICTSGHADGIQRLASLGWKRLNLSVSLNAGSDAVRSTLMPVNRRTPLAELQRLLASYPQRRNFTLGVNYCLLPGINDRLEDARGVADFCAPLGRVLVNLVPYNPGSAPLCRPPSEAEIAGFIEQLRGCGLPVRRRLTKGRGIMAACGQLGRRQARQRGRQTAVPPEACTDPSRP